MKLRLVPITAGFLLPNARFMLVERCSVNAGLTGVTVACSATRQ